MLPGVYPLGNFWSLAFLIMLLQAELQVVVIRFTGIVSGSMGMLSFEECIHCTHEAYQASFNILFNMHQLLENMPTLRIGPLSVHIVCSICHWCKNIIKEKRGPLTLLYKVMFLYRLTWV